MRINSQQPGAQSVPLSVHKNISPPSLNPPKPSWLKVRAFSSCTPGGKKYLQIKSLLKAKKLHTVCSEAACPNASECWSSGTATFMVLGDTCTRACRFCNVKSGNPHGRIDKQEPQKLVEAVKTMGLDYVVLTCVTRDDLDDCGAGHFASCIRALKKNFPKLKIEVLISDLGGNHRALKKIIAAAPDVIGHNIETVERLQKTVRDPRAGYGNSLAVLESVKKITYDLSKAQDGKKSLRAQTFGGKSVCKLYTKSAIMVGLGETPAEVIETMKDLRTAGVDLLTIGQYLRPGPYHLPVKEYVTPAQFRAYETVAKKLGFLYCASGPFVRSSYRAGEMFMKK